ncbi:hypothetical protein WJX82_004320 [Trebouxia sp. C0006]
MSVPAPRPAPQPAPQPVGGWAPRARTQLALPAIGVVAVLVANVTYLGWATPPGGTTPYWAGCTYPLYTANSQPDCGKQRHTSQCLRAAEPKFRLAALHNMRTYPAICQLDSTRWHPGISCRVRQEEACHFSG